MFYAGGYTVVFNKDKDLIMHVQPSQFSMSGESETAQALGVPWEPGVVQVLASAQTQSTLSASLVLQKVSATDLSLLLNTQLEEVGGLIVPSAFQAIVPAATPYTVSVTGLPANATPTINVTQNKAQKKLEQASGTPGAGEYAVSANTLTFNAAEAGKQITGVYLKTVTASKRVLGGTSTGEAIGEISFYGKLLGTEEDAEIYIPKFIPGGAFELPLIGAAGEDLTIEGAIATPAGWSRPYQIVVE